MRGDFCHNEILVRRLRELAEACGATVHTEQPVRTSDTLCYADLVIEKDGRLTVCEVERSWHRVENDRRKAIALGAEWLLIATPDAPTAHACRRQLRRLARLDAQLKVLICPFGAALEILRAILTANRTQTGTGPSNQRNET